MGRIDDLEGWAVDVGLRVTPSQWNDLQRLIELWRRYGATFNLVGSTAVAALVEHVREGLMAVRVAQLAGDAGGVWLDVGSGAGIPGLVVALVRGNVVMLEPRERRAAFLRLAVSQLKARESTVVRGRLAQGTLLITPAEALDGPDMSRLEVASAKAVMPVEKWLRESRELLPCGIVVCHVVRDASACVAHATARLDFDARSVVALAAGA